jgi:hypothetical protein
MANLAKLFSQLSLQERIQGEFWYTQARLSCNLLAVRHQLTTEKVAQVVALPLGIQPCKLQAMFWIYQRNRVNAN